MDTNDLYEKLLAINVIHFGNYVLKGGLATPVYIDLRKVISYPRTLAAVAEEIWKRIQGTGLKFDCICGVPYAALPIATCLCINHNLPMVIQRKEVKTHGTKKLVEGEIKTGSTCLIVEDVVTSGASIIDTAKVCDTF
ncbi:unnamed protein product [Soboliphyme baturini]|uniref:orotate phosphoribosyltransferase n=1 Tax=Soboliphyme baturini TaxID=241478 RepID=A0A183IRU3_9BILA|nr:unnamed protein product [Soboliphyme baturini]